ncbi:MAG TPA: PDZ domain-containing protein [Thermoanaerobaculia bacterium]|nr:PDZ domain-containing protein [Thermoanaerobaculia bacterium]
MRARIVGVLLLGSTALACASGRGATPRDLFPESATLRSEAGDQSLTARRTFFLLPAPGVSPGLLLNLRNELQRCGYHESEVLESADFLAHLTTREGFAPRRRRSSPLGSWSTGRTVRVVTFQAPDFQGVMAPSAASYGASPGGGGPSLTSGPFWQHVALEVLDPATREPLWSGAASSAVKRADPALSGQILLHEVVEAMAASGGDPIRRATGAELAIVTVDGRIYRPVVVGVRRGSAAARAGLQRYDVLAAVRGQPTDNLDFSSVAALLTASQDAELVVERRGRRGLRILDY